MAAHDIDISEELERNFLKVAERGNELVESFKLTKERIIQNKKTLSMLHKRRARGNK